VDALLTKGVSRQKHFLARVLLLLSVISIAVIAAFVGVFVGVISCAFAPFGSMTFSGAWSLYGLNVSVIVAIVSFVVCFLLLMMMIAINDIMLATLSPAQHTRVSNQMR
jgi:uncharacterized membrane protein